MLSSTLLQSPIAWIGVGKMGLPSELTITNSEAKRNHQVFPATNVVLKNFDSWAAAILGKGVYRYTNDQIIDNIKVLEAIVESSNQQSKLIQLI